MTKKESASRTDHDLLMALANDMRWIKGISTLYAVPLTLIAIKFLATWTSG